MHTNPLYIKIKLKNKSAQAALQKLHRQTLSNFKFLFHTYASLGQGQKL